MVKGIEVPPKTEDFAADPVELFFDLAYVVAFSQLVGFLHHDPTWAGVGQAALLFGLMWLPWQELTWSANAVSGNGRLIRLIFLAGTAISVPMAVTATSALEEGGLVFAVCLSLIMTLGFVVQTMSVERGSVHHVTVWRWVTPNVAAIAVLITGAFVEGSGRLVLWLVAGLIVFAAMVLAGRGDWVVRIGHMAERHGLIIIIAFGEVIVTVGRPVIDALEAGEGVPGDTLLALVASGMFACLLWWAYFDRPSPSFEHRGVQLESDNERGRFVRDVYTWSHAPVVAGVILTAAALEEVAVHPADPVSTPSKAMLSGGLALIMVGVSAAVWRAHGVLARERLLIGAVAALAVLAAGDLAGVTVLVVVVAVIVAALAVEHVRIERT